MVVYIEIAFLENFLIDVTLLWLAMFATKRKIRPLFLCLAGIIGTLFALFFPLFTLPRALEYFLKFAVGALLVFIAFRERGWAKFALTSVYFFGASFCFAGAVFAIGDYFREKEINVHAGFVLSLLLLFSLCFACVIKQLHKRRKMFRFVYHCALFYQDRTVRSTGFLDSGNQATAHGKTVCFLSPDLVYDLFGASEEGETMEIATVSGNKKIKIFQADRLEIYCGNKRHTIEKIYCSPFVGMVKREYKILLGAGVLEYLTEQEGV